MICEWVATAVTEHIYSILSYTFEFEFDFESK